MAKRKIVRIEEAKCTGCGKCVSPCAEGAIEIRDGKAHVKTEALCDGAGFCLGICPTGALSIEEREAPDFDLSEVRRARAASLAQAAEGLPEHLQIKCFQCGASDADRVLLPVRRHGESEWVCTRCLPSLIHG